MPSDNVVAPRKKEGGGVEKRQSLVRRVTLWSTQILLQPVTFAESVKSQL